MDVISFHDVNDRREFWNEDHFVMSIYDKKKLKLDLTNKVKKQDNSNAILTSPDLKLLKLDSPELERIILATAGSATPTPKQYRRGKGTSDLSVKEQQEHYVRGFEDALNKMRQQAASTAANESISTNINNTTTSTFGAVVVSNNNNNNIVNFSLKPVHHEHEINGGSLYTTMAPTVASNPHFQTIPTINYGGTTQADMASYEQQPSFRNDTNRTTTAAMSIERTHDIVPVVQHVVPTTDDITAAELLVEPIRPTTLASNDMTITMDMMREQSVYSSQAQTTSSNSSSPLSTVPIDLHKQEIVKTERKKHRNRVAASKCRKRKLERESGLQETVDELKTRNVELGEMAATLRKQVCELKLKVMDHVKSGCEVLLAQPAIRT